jgi:hypothetical protein|nr:MAG TPA: hypothetical protein [Inoviridae sp.]
MRMKTVGNTRFSYKLDKIFWFIISFFPLFSWLIYLFSFSGYNESPLTFFAWIEQNFGFLGQITNSVIYSTFYQIFSITSVNSLFPVLSTSLMAFFTYLITVEIVHVIYDVIVFIPRLAHKWISKAVQDD